MIQKIPYLVLTISISVLLMVTGCKLYVRSSGNTFTIKAGKERYPFPQSKTFKHSLKPTHKTQKQLNEEIVAFYELWKKDYVKTYPNSTVTYIEGDATGHVPSGWPKGTMGVSTSEATGYGMIIFTLMAGHDRDAQRHFDGLVQLYLKHKSINSEGMSWLLPDKLDSTFEKSTSATDGDLDIAYGLLLADKQWGSDGTYNYKAIARNLIEKSILTHGISDNTGRVLMGDWVKGNSGRYNETTSRPSDWMISHLKAFQKEFPHEKWDKAIAEIYRIIPLVQNSKTGLFPDFMEDVNGQPQKVIKDLSYVSDKGGAVQKFLEGPFDDAYNWNACRVPWRIATDYVHYNSDVSKEALNTLNKWSTTISSNPSVWPSKIWHGYTLDGEKLNPNDPWSWSLAFTAPMVSALVASDVPQHQEYLNGGWDFMAKNFLGDHKDEGWTGYFADTIALMNMLLISGNWWNPAS